MVKQWAWCSLSNVYAEATLRDSPLLRLQVLKQGCDKLSDQHHELVQSQPVNSKPLTPHCAHEDCEIQESNLQ